MVITAIEKILARGRERDRESYSPVLGGHRKYNSDIGQRLEGGEGGSRYWDEAQPRPRQQQLAKVLGREAV